jgi:hypothetical protein
VKHARTSVRTGKLAQKGRGQLFLLVFFFSLFSPPALFATSGQKHFFVDKRVQNKLTVSSHLLFDPHSLLIGSSVLPKLPQLIPNAVLRLLTAILTVKVRLESSDLAVAVSDLLLRLVLVLGERISFEDGVDGTVDVWMDVDAFVVGHLELFGDFGVLLSNEEEFNEGR